MRINSALFITLHQVFEGVLKRVEESIEFGIHSRCIAEKRVSSFDYILMLIYLLLFSLAISL